MSTIRVQTIAKEVYKHFLMETKKMKLRSYLYKSNNGVLSFGSKLLNRKGIYVENYINMSLFASMRGGMSTMFGCKDKITNVYALIENITKHIGGDKIVDVDSIDFQRSVQNATNYLINWLIEPFMPLDTDNKYVHSKENAQLLNDLGSNIFNAVCKKFLGEGFKDLMEESGELNIPPNFVNLTYESFVKYISEKGRIPFDFETASPYTYGTYGTATVPGDPTSLFD